MKISRMFSLDSIYLTTMLLTFGCGSSNGAGGHVAAIARQPLEIAAVSNEAQKSEAAVALADGVTYKLQVTSVWDHKNPFALQAHVASQLPDSLYQPATSPSSYAIVFSNAQKSVEIVDSKAGSAKLLGTLASTNSSLRFYNIESGLMSGGRLLIWASANGSLKAELSVYGSGVPLVESLQGDVSK